MEFTPAPLPPSALPAAVRNPAYRPLGRRASAAPGTSRPGSAEQRQSSATERPSRWRLRRSLLRGRVPRRRRASAAQCAGGPTGPRPTRVSWVCGATTGGHAMCPATPRLGVTARRGPRRRRSLRRRTPPGLSPQRSTSSHSRLQGPLDATAAPGAAPARPPIAVSGASRTPALRPARPLPVPECHSRGCCLVL